MSKTKRLTISVCTYQNSDFEVILKDKDTDREVILYGIQKLDDEELDFLNEFAPACVFTTYTREDI